MSVSEQERHQLYVVAESVFGTEGSATMMELLPPTGWADVARKDDVAAVRSDLTAVRGDLTAVRAEIVTLDQRWSEQMAAHDARWSERANAQDEKWSRLMAAQDEKWSSLIAAQDEKWSSRMDATDARMDALENRLLSKIDELRAEFFKSQESQTRLVVFGMITMVVAVAALAFGAARLS